MDDLDKRMDEACDGVGASPKQKCAFPVELEEAFYLCAEGGMSLSEFAWKAKKLVVEAAVSQHNTKVEAAGDLGIAPYSLWRIENDIHK